MRIKRLKHLLSAMLLSLPLSVGAAIDAPFLFIDDQIEAHTGQSGIYVTKPLF